MIRIAIMLMLISVFLSAENNVSRKDILYTNLAGAAFITAWGVANWGYGENDLHNNEEGWFGPSTGSGGTDKLGHLYMAYIIGSGLSGLYEYWGYSEKDAALYGSASSFFLMNYMELGDGFSDQFGFSYEDFIMNTIGAFSSYFFYTNPELSKRIDLRMEYFPRFDRTDVVTDYENMKYLLAFKAEGFDCISNPYLKYAELQLGYYTRNYTDGFSLSSERMVYVGVGINLSRALRQNDHKKTARLFNYYQLPYTYVPFEKDLNE